MKKQARAKQKWMHKQENNQHQQQKRCSEYKVVIKMLKHKLVTKNTKLLRRMFPKM